MLEALHCHYFDDVSTYSPLPLTIEFQQPVVGERAVVDDLAVRRPSAQVGFAQQAFGRAGNHDMRDMLPETRMLAGPEVDVIFVGAVGIESLSIGELVFVEHG